MAGQNIFNDARIFDAFRRHGVPFVVVGGHAVMEHGHVRNTEDVDIVWSRTDESEQQILAALKEINAAWISNERDPVTRMERLVPVSPAYIKSEHLMMLWTDCGPLDLFDYIPGSPDENVAQLFDTAVENNGLRFASLHWLRRMKLAAGRPKDLLDLEELAKRHPQ